MCTVQVMLFAEVTRRSDAFGGGVGRGGVCRKLFAEVTRRSDAFGGGVGRGGVCRKLFGNDAAADCRDTARVAKEMEAQLRREKNNRWNFDFERETPLPGRFQWVPVGVPRSQMRATAIEESAADEQPRIVDEVLRPCRKPTTRAAHLLKGKRYSAGAASSANQHKITDFMTTKKRSHVKEVSSPHKLKLRRLSSGGSLPSASTRPT